MCSELQLSLISVYREECAILSLKLPNPQVYSALKGFSLSECINFLVLDAFKMQVARSHINANPFKHPRNIFGQMHFF